MLTDPLGHRVPDPSATSYYDNPELDGDDDDSTTPPHHRQAAEAAVEAIRQNSHQPTRREEWMLSHRWRMGLRSSSIVCDAPPDMDEALRAEHEVWYGGLMVLEGCPDCVRDHIIDLHNAALPPGDA